MSKTTAETFGRLYGDEFICSESAAPTKFAVISEQTGWFTAFYNSFSPLHELALDMSRRLDTVVIVTFAQTTSSGYHLSIFRSGQHLRTLEFADGEWIRQEGALLDFESEPLGKNVAGEGEKPWYVFEAESVSEYCEHFGLKFWSNAYVDFEHPEFTILSI
ncbi:MAG: hypothetical protein ACTHLW_19235 [Verrucomicrobiota bacterium]